MKKLLVLVLTLGMLIGVTSVSMAAGTVSLDVLTSGNFNDDDALSNLTDDSLGDFDLSQTTIGFDIPINNFKIAGSYSSGDYKIKHFNGSFDTSSLMLKGGFAALNSKNVRLDITGGYFTRDLDYPLEINLNKRVYYKHELSLSSLSIGLDSKFVFQDNMWLDVDFALGINPKDDISYNGSSESEGDLDSLTTLNLKFNYLFTKQFGGSLGYNWEEWKYKNSWKNTFSGLTAGVFFKF